MQNNAIYNIVDEYIGNNGKIFYKEDIVNIGLKHIALPKNERNWNLLANLVNYNGSGVSYRKFIERKRRELEAQEKIPGVEYRNEYIQKTQIRDINNAYRQTLRDAARIDTFKEAICDSLEKANFNLPVISSKKFEGQENEAILMISDWHLGVCCDNFYNEYNKEIAWERINKLAYDTIYYCKKHDVKTLNVVALGDFIQGIIHTSARIEAELNIADEITTAATYIANFLTIVKSAAPKITYRTCTDNHSRAIASKDESLEAENFGKVIDFIVEIMLKDDTDIEFVNDNLDPSLGRFKLNNGKVIMYSHGHLDNINNAFQNFVGASREFVDYILLAHYHCEKTKSFQGTKVFVNGSLCGTEQYALSKRLFSDPSQKLLIFDTNDDVIDIGISV